MRYIAKQLSSLIDVATSAALPILTPLNAQAIEFSASGQINRLTMARKVDWYTPTSRAPMSSSIQDRAVTFSVRWNMELPG